MKRTFIIAEAGVNHNGDLELAKELIDKAKEANVDAVKFQTAKPENVISKFAPKSKYQIKNTNNETESQLEMVKKISLKDEHWPILQEYAKSKEILFLSTPFDLGSIDLLHQLQVPIFKIPSGEITNMPYLRKIGQIKKPVILSTGMCNLGDIENAIQILTESGMAREQITLLHCNTQYPTPFEDVNLLAIKTLQQAFKVPVGYSDHTLGIHIPIAAVSMGAQVIEKHFTLDRKLPGPDHLASLEPNELKEMVRCIRDIEVALGNGIKTTSSSERENRILARKSIVARCSIKAGEILSEKNLYTKRPSGGISPME